MVAFATDEAFAASKTHLKKTSIALMTGSTYQQKLYTASNKAISASKVKWTSNNSKVAKVSKTGKVTAVSNGTTTIKAKYSGKTYSFKVKVKNSGYLQIWPPKYDTCVVGGTMKFELWSNADGDYDPSKIEWASSNNDILTVNQKGTVTGISLGTAKVYATYGNYRYEREVTVTRETLENLGIESYENLSGGNSVFCKFKTNYIKGVKAEVISGNNLVKQVYSAEKKDDYYYFMVCNYPKTTGEAQVKVYLETDPSLYHIYTINFGNSSTGGSQGSLTCKTALPHVCIGDSGVLFRVDSISGKLEYKGQMISLSITGTCTGILGNRKEGSGRINYRLYDSKGFVVSTGSFFTGNIREGDKIKLQKSVFPAGYNDSSITNLVDDYVIEIYGDTED